MQNKIIPSVVVGVGAAAEVAPLKGHRGADSLLTPESSDAPLNGHFLT